MIPIYLCEDEETIRSYFVEQIREYIMIQDYDMEIVCESAKPKEILQMLSGQPRRGIYFLDVDLKDAKYDGFTLAKQIRKIDEGGFIIFVTTHDELTFETFRHHLEAMDYIVKDDLVKDNNGNIIKRIRECLDEIQRKFQVNISATSNHYSVSIFGTIYHLPYKDILYFETSQKKHRLRAHCKTEILEFFESLSKVEQDVGNHFLRVHRSFLVNRETIKKYYTSENRLELENGESCPVSRALKREIKQLLMKY